MGLRVGGWECRLWLIRLSGGNLGVERQLSGGGGGMRIDNRGLELLSSSGGHCGLSRVVVVVVVGGIWRRVTVGLRQALGLWEGDGGLT